MTLSRLACHSLKATEENGQDSDPFKIGCLDEVLFRDFAGDARSCKVATCYSLDGRSSDVETYSRCVLPCPYLSLPPKISDSTDQAQASCLQCLTDAQKEPNPQNHALSSLKLLVRISRNRNGRFLGELNRGRREFSWHCQIGSWKAQSDGPNIADELTELSHSHFRVHDLSKAIVPSGGGASEILSLLSFYFAILPLFL